MNDAGRTELVEIGDFLEIGLAQYVVLGFGAEPNQLIYNGGGALLFSRDELIGLAISLGRANVAVAIWKRGSYSSSSSSSSRSFFLN